jgi:predicted nucleotidyltransferase
MKSLSSIFYPVFLVTILNQINKQVMENIPLILKSIEKSRGIRILYACETGSRAWGFPSPDSDYDVRFLYAHERDWYLSLHHRKDSVEHMDGDLDATGWDLRKSLLLLKKSNVPLIERFQSPILYYADEEFTADFKTLVKTYYSPRAVFFHHLSLAKKFWEGLSVQNEVRLKSLFYLVRSLLSCDWITKDDDVLPMHIEGLMKYTDPELCVRLRELIHLKSRFNESYMHPKDLLIDSWVRTKLKTFESLGDSLKVNSSDMLQLNKFFLKTVYGKADN